MKTNDEITNLKKKIEKLEDELKNCHGKTIAEIHGGDGEGPKFVGVRVYVDGSYSSSSAPFNGHHDLDSLGGVLVKYIREDLCNG